MWDQFTAEDRPLELPAYAGRIDPAHWVPRVPEQDPSTARHATAAEARQPQPPTPAADPSARPPD